jgi:hypothetical protein
MDRLVAQLGKGVSELKGKNLVRYAAMCSCYPGSGARYGFRVFRV